MDGICESEELTRPELAADLELNPSSLATAAYRGEIGMPLVERLCARAGATDQEFVDLEMAWLRLRATRPRDDALRRSLGIIAASRAWLAKRGLLEEYEG